VELNFDGCFVYLISMQLRNIVSFGREIHVQIDNSGIEWTIELRTSLLNMYAKCESIDDVLFCIYFLANGDSDKKTSLSVALRNPFKLVLLFDGIAVGRLFRSVDQFVS